MLIFKTCFGDYLLQNSSRIDLFKTKEGEIWQTFITIDSHKHMLHRFESEVDATGFCQTLREKIRFLLRLYATLEDKVLVQDLSKLVSETMEIIINDTQNILTNQGIGELV